MIVADVVLFHHAQGLTDGHLFVDSALPSYDAEATALVVERSRAFLHRVG